MLHMFGNLNWTGQWRHEDGDKCTPPDGNLTERVMVPAIWWQVVAIGNRYCGQGGSQLPALASGR